MKPWGWIVLFALSAGAGSGVGWAFYRYQEWSDFQAAEVLATENPQRAVEKYLQYLERHPHEHAVRLSIAKLMRNRDPELALAQLRQVPVEAAEFVTAARLTAAISLQLGRDYDAVQPLKELARLSPDEPGPPLALGEIAFRARDFEAALQSARAATKLDPALLEAWLLAADALDELHRSEEMIVALGKVLELDPESPPGHINLAHALMRTGKPSEAITHVRWYLARYPDSPAGHRVLAQVLRGQDKYNEALQAARRSLELQPGNLETALLEAELLILLDQPRDAYEKLTRLFEVVGNERQLLNLRFRAATLSGEREAAQELQERLTRLQAGEG